MIKLDFTQISTVVTCTSCRGWSQVTDSKVHGWALGSAHQLYAHPGEDQAADALRKAQAAARR